MAAEGSEMLRPQERAVVGNSMEPCRLPTSQVLIKMSRSSLMRRPRPIVSYLKIIREAPSSVPESSYIPDLTTL